MFACYSVGRLPVRVSEPPLSNLPSRSHPQDVFVLYLAGHGSRFDCEFQFIPWSAVYTS